MSAQVWSSESEPQNPHTISVPWGTSLAHPVAKSETRWVKQGGERELEPEVVLSSPQVYCGTYSPKCTHTCTPYTCACKVTSKIKNQKEESGKRYGIYQFFLLMCIVRYRIYGQKMINSFCPSLNVILILVNNTVDSCYSPVSHATQYNLHWS